MSLTGQQLLTGFSKFIADHWSSATDSNGLADGTTLVDSKLAEFDNDTIRGWYIRITSGDNDQEVRRIRSNVGSTGTVTVRPAFSNQVATGVTYEMHRYDPSRKFSVMDEARIRAYPDLFRIVYDESETADGYATEFPISSDIRKGPAFVFQEEPLSTTHSWNFVQNGIGDSLTGWTASSTTASVHSRTNDDPLIPKYDHACTKLSTANTQAATYTQTVDNMMGDITAALAADREMTFGAWVYCTEANKVRVGITDDVDTTYSSYHAGNGWELLTVEKTIYGGNASTLSVLFDIASTAHVSVIYWNRAWFYFGSKERITEVYPIKLGRRIHRDTTKQAVLLPWHQPPPRGCQLRFVGRNILSELGSATPQTSTMELDEPTSLLFYAYAAQTLFEGEAINAAMPDEVNARIGQVLSRKSDYQSQWPFYLPAPQSLKGWWSA